MNKYELAKDATFYRETVIFTLPIILKWETLIKMYRCWLSQIGKARH